MQNLGGAGKATEEEAIPLDYKVLKPKDSLVIVKFPKPTLLYSLKEKEGFRLFLDDNQLIHFLQNLISNSEENYNESVDKIVSSFEKRSSFPKVLLFSSSSSS